MDWYESCCWPGAGLCGGILSLGLLLGKVLVGAAVGLDWTGIKAAVGQARCWLGLLLVWATVCVGRDCYQGWCQLGCCLGFCLSWLLSAVPIC
jgi:hypothetical protein